jgi:hypothetical protein
MELLVLVLFFIILGYFLGASSLSDEADRTTERVAVASKRWIDRLDHRWKTSFGRGNFARSFREWANEKNADLFPENFRTWLGELNDLELQDFASALSQYSQSLGFDLKVLIEGGLDNEPIMRQVFVEAITVYSTAYRKARQAQQQAEDSEKIDHEKTNDDRAMKPAEKASSHRTSDDKKEVIEPASTD